MICTPVPKLLLPLFLSHSPKGSHDSQMVSLAWHSYQGLLLEMLSCSNTTVSHPLHSPQTSSLPPLVSLKDESQQRGNPSILLPPPSLCHQNLRISSCYSRGAALFPGKASFLPQPRSTCVFSIYLLKGSFPPTFKPLRCLSS